MLLVNESLGLTVTRMRSLCNTWGVLFRIYLTPVGENVRFVCNAADGVTLTLDSRKRFKFLQDINTFTAVLLQLFLRVEKQELFMLRSLTHAWRRLFFLICLFFEVFTLFIVTNRDMYHSYYSWPFLGHWRHPGKGSFPSPRQNLTLCFDMGAFCDPTVRECTWTKNGSK